MVKNLGFPNRRDREEIETKENIQALFPKFFAAAPCSDSTSHLRFHFQIATHLPLQPQGRKITMNEEKYPRRNE